MGARSRVERVRLYLWRPVSSSVIRQILHLLDSRQRRQFWSLLVAALVLAVLELLGVAVVLPFMALLASPEIIGENELAAWAYRLGGFASERDFIIAAGLGVLLTLAVSRLAFLLNDYYQSLFVFGLDHTFSDRLLRYYLARPYAFFLEANTSELRNNVIQEVRNLATGYLREWFLLVTAGMTALAIIVLLLAIDPMVAVSTALVLGGAYYLTYRSRRRWLDGIGQERMEQERLRWRAVNELFSGLKTVRIFGAENSFYQRFEAASRSIAVLPAKRRFVQQLPKSLLEVTSFGGIIVLTLYLYLRNGSLASALPTLTLFAVAGYRLLPSLQAAFGALVVMRSNRAVVHHLYEELRLDTGGDQFAAWQPHAKLTPLPFRRTIQVSQLGYAYRTAANPLFEDLNLTIHRGQTIAFAGQTGSGKTTLIDLLTGLLTPTEGSITIDGVPLSPANAANWRAALAYVPQQVYLYDGTLAQNLLFGRDADLATAERDRRCWAALEAADLADFVRAELPAGLQTRVGEAGVRLSGGQRQRVGLARALYARPSVLILDEATSALDTLTEHRILVTLKRLKADTTVMLIAHRLSTVKHADVIYLLEEGKLVGQGTFNDLQTTHPRFREMVAAS